MAPVSPGIVLEGAYFRVIVRVAGYHAAELSMGHFNEVVERFSVGRGLEVVPAWLADTENWRVLVGTWSERRQRHETEGRNGSVVAPARFDSDDLEERQIALRVPYLALNLDGEAGVEEKPLAPVARFPLLFRVAEAVSAG
jgi:hypothetical protein